MIEFENIPEIDLTHKNLKVFKNINETKLSVQYYLPIRLFIESMLISVLIQIDYVFDQIGFETIKGVNQFDGTKI